MAFAGESFFQVPVPNYGHSHVVVSVLLILSLVFWIFVVPVCLSKEITVVAPAEPQSQNETKITNNDKKNKKKNPSGITGSKKKDDIDTDTKKKKENKSNQVPDEATTVIREVPLWASALAVVGFMTTTSVILLYYSPYNSWLPRRVFVAPVFTGDECHEILNRAMVAAERNRVQAEAKVSMAGGWDQIQDGKENTTLTYLLDHPSGWQKMRHGAYPTTDLNLVTDPFTKEDRDYIGNLLDRRLSPVMARVLGISKGSIRSNDMFVVRYDVGRRVKLANHSDDGDISFNILLSDDFEGGGTRFWNRAQEQPFAHVQPAEPGTVLFHSALIHHEGMPVSNGTRIILVGFTSIARVDPWHNTWTGLSWLASWGNLNFLTVKLKDSVQNTERRLGENLGHVKQWDEWEAVRFLFADIYDAFLTGFDQWATHVVETLVSNQDKTRFLQTLDDDYDRQMLMSSSSSSKERELGQASWFKGQQIHINVVRIHTSCGSGE